MSYKSEEIRERHRPITKAEASELLLAHQDFEDAGGKRDQQWEHQGCL